MEKLLIFVKILFSFSLLYFASSLIFLTLELSKIRVSIPEFLASVQKMEEGENINSILKSITQISGEIPEILKEVKLLRELTPSILEQVNHTTSAIPSVLVELKKTRESIPPILAEVKATRESIGPILAESKSLRKEIPPQLDKVEKITEHMQSISSDAASGAVSGTFDGIISVPENLVTKTKNVITGNSADEIK